MLDPQVTKAPIRKILFLWKLSYIYGKRDADISLSFERIVNEPKTLEELFDFCHIDKSYLEKNIYKINHGLARDKWEEYADEDWYVLESSAELN